MKHIEPIALKAGDKRVLINGKLSPRDFRIIAEEEYQLLRESYEVLKAIKLKNIDSKRIKT